MYKAILTMVFLGLATVSFAQSLEELQERRKSALEDLNYTNLLLEKSQENEKVSLNELSLINNKISVRTKIITDLNTEIGIIQSFIDNNNLVISIIQDDLQVIREEYAEMIRGAYRNRNVSGNLLYLLSSHDFNQAFKRHLYFKQYAGYRKVQANTIQSMQEVIEKKVSNLSSQAVEKMLLLDEQKKEYEHLNLEKEQQSLVLSKMQQEQKLLRQKFNEQQQVEQELEKQIQNIIEEEARKSREKGLPGFSLTPEQKLAGDNFQQNKSRLPWPVERGLISEKFGVHPHPTLANITTSNNGVDIITEPEAVARAVFNGEVSRVFVISGGNMAVIVRHGEFLTVYSNLSEVIVKAGDKVNTKQMIGTIYSDQANSGNAILKFQVWFKNQKLDPEEWIVK